MGVDEYMGNAGAPEEAGQLQPPIAETATAQPAAPEPITKLEFEQFKNELKDELKRTIQSQTGKAESRIKKEVESKLMQVDANFKSLREAGYPVTDDDLKAARSQAMRETMTTLSGDEDAAQRNQPAVNPQEQAAVKQTNDELRAMQKQYGYVLGKNDPEFWEIAPKFYDFNNESWIGPPDEFKRAYQEKLQEVNTRLGRPLPAPQQAQVGNPAARVPAPAGAPIGGLESTTEEYNRLLNKVNPTNADTKRRKELEAEIMKQIPKR